MSVLVCARLAFALCFGFSCFGCHFAFIYLTGATLRIRDLGWQQQQQAVGGVTPAQALMLNLIVIVVRVFAAAAVVSFIVVAAAVAGFSHHGKEHFGVAVALRRRLSSPFWGRGGRRQLRLLRAHTHRHTHESVTHT